MHWLLLLLLGFSALPAEARTISVSELNYAPLDGSDFEFIELINLGTATVALTGAQFTNGIDYKFDTATLLKPGARLVICSDRTLFGSRYGNNVPLAASKFKGKLDDQGEQITLVSASGEILFQFKYDSSGDWPSRANGLGSSLECIDPDGKLNDPANWRSSTEYNGSPGVAGVGPIRPVVINEILAHTDPPLEDAIELYNPTNQTVDISGWYLSNNRAKPAKYHIPNGTRIGPGGYHVFFGKDFNRAGDPNRFTLNSANGDEAVLMSTDTSGRLLHWIDATSFEPSENGVSFGRYPNGTGPLVTLADLALGTPVRNYFPPSFLAEFQKAPGAANGLPRVGPVIFSVIQYRPAPDDFEYIELRNITGAPVSLFDPLNPKNTWRLREGVDFDFPGGVSLTANATIIVCATNPAAFRLKHGLPASALVLGPWTNQLSNSGERIALYKPDPPQLPPHPDAGLVPFILVEEIHYNDSDPWPVLADNQAFRLERKTTGYGATGTNWTAVATALVPPPRPVLSTSFTELGSLRITFQQSAGVAYFLETRTTLRVSVWTRGEQVPISATPTTASIVVPINESPRFFRVVAP
ncbi:MAG: lamin tail domain-containing protein [Pedosphaera sp.]|nr:lamin tail domain-containing protein [Pedosphaera sp.]